MAIVSRKQKKPKVNGHPRVVDLVRTDLDARLRAGIRTYGTPLQPFNGRSALRDAYEEALDLAIYLRQLLFEENHSKMRSDAKKNKRHRGSTRTRSKRKA